MSSLWEERGEDMNNELNLGLFINRIDSMDKTLEIVEELDFSKRVVIEVSPKKTKPMQEFDYYISKQEVIK